LEHSIDRARRRRDRKFKPLVLGQIQAAGDTHVSAVAITLVRSRHLNPERFCLYHLSMRIGGELEHLNGCLLIAE
jgi:hypothetical protein